MKISPKTPLNIGTRGSPLALAQAHETRDRLMTATGLPEQAFTIHVIKTTGDAILDRPLSEIGGKGLFTKEIEQAMIDGDIDIAVHSMKDMPVQLPAGLVIECYLPREDVRDAFISLKYDSIDEVPKGAVVGTSSLRRRAQLAAVRPDLELVEFRGNVQTRLKKLEDGVADATFLAMAGLTRLGMAHIAKPIETDVMLPAIAQGCIGIEHRADDTETGALLAMIHHEPSGVQLAAERALLAGLDGSCQTPIAGLATLDGNQMHLKGEVLRPDGSEILTDSMSGAASDGAKMGAAMADTLRAQMSDDFFGS